jgi:EAL domain-containing protein (putative c-di-GMP-specific phosphodiesterase class I)
MYAAKARGKRRVAVFEPSMHAAVVAEHDLARDLRRAVLAQEFVLQYQPIVTVSGGDLTGFEALLRWKHPERGLLQPGSFIDQLERSELIVDIGGWVLEEACRQAVAWRQLAASDRMPRISVNVAARQLQSADFVDTVRRVLQTSGLEPSALELEVTESTVLQDAQNTLATLNRLHRLGVRIAVDDFGTGYSSLSYLMRLPVTTLKIAREFLGEANTNPRARELIKAILALGRVLHLDVVAEGVEQEEQLGLLRALGCSHAQGFYFARPLDTAWVGPTVESRLYLPRRSGLGTSSPVAEPGDPASLHIVA